MLQTLPVATHQEMDSLYRDFHQLKRRIMVLEKKMRHKQQPQTI
jgi:polyhydroxyalkanoate synthesis regulator phasin